MPLAITGPVTSLQMFVSLWVSQSLALTATLHQSQWVPLQVPKVCSLSLTPPLCLVAFLEHQ